MGRKVRALEGAKFGRYEVIDSYKGECGKMVCICVCECGELRPVTRNNLVSGNSRSCGCLKSEIISDLKHIHGRNLSDPTYLSWSAMRARCSQRSSQNYGRYGGVGITISKEWDYFLVFLKDMGERKPNTTLDRIDPSKGYSKNNCRWASPVEQRRNQSRKSFRFVEYKGAEKILTDWCRELGIPYLRTLQRLSKGWSVENAFTKPSRWRNFAMPTPEHPI